MTKFDELCAKLKEIFELDKPELDFGIYRIIHTRAKEINAFLETRLAQKVKAALAGNSAAEKAVLEKELNDAIAQAKALGADPNVLPKVQELKAKIAAIGIDEDPEASVYSHLLDFFSRYYDAGDFVSKRRYKDGVYAIPYAGEEVKLHWANADQYYIKSGENFQNYSFKLDDGARVSFKLVAAETAKDNIKDNDAVRCFVLWNPDEAANVEDEERAASLPKTILEDVNGELVIYFQYLKFKKGTKQADLIKDAQEKIAIALGQQKLLIKYNVLALAPTEKEKKRTVLGKHLQQYVAKNTSDYFIHKDLKGFLTRELDFYIKNEMMHLDDVMSAESFKVIEQNLRKIQAVRTIATELITFMAQLEDFQKKLWLKKKFVTQCDYCLTMDRVPEELRAEVLANAAQQDEWKRLGFEMKPASDLFAHDAIDARMVDTKVFPAAFKEKLLRSIPNLDEQCDGLLIHADNFQALNLIQDLLSGAVNTIYTDPPYNADATCIIYKNGYRHSSWNSLLVDRLNLGKKLLADSGVCCVTIDDYELYNLKQLLDISFGDANFLANVVIRNNPSGRSTVSGFAVCHEYGLFYAKSREHVTISRLEHTQAQKNRYSLVDDAGKSFEWENLRKSSAGSYRSDRPKQFFPIYYSSESQSLRVPLCQWNSVANEYDILDACLPNETPCYPIDAQGRERVWGFGIERVRNEAASGDISVQIRDGRIELYKRNISRRTACYRVHGGKKLNIQRVIMVQGRLQTCLGLIVGLIFRKPLMQ